MRNKDMHYTPRSGKRAARNRDDSASRREDRRRDLDLAAARKRKREAAL